MPSIYVKSDLFIGFGGEIEYGRSQRGRSASFYISFVFNFQSLLVPLCLFLYLYLFIISSYLFFRSSYVAPLFFCPSYVVAMSRSCSSTLRALSSGVWVRFINFAFLIIIIITLLLLHFHNAVALSEDEQGDRVWSSSHPCHVSGIDCARMLQEAPSLHGRVWRQQRDERQVICPLICLSCRLPLFLLCLLIEADRKLDNNLQPDMPVDEDTLA